MHYDEYECEICGEGHETEDHLKPKDFEDNKLAPHQDAMYEMYELIAEGLGKWDSSAGAHGAHYASAEDNPFIEKGLICSNCVFYEGGGGCEIVVGPAENGGRVEPNAICKLWIIPEDLIKEQGEEEEGEEESESSVEVGDFVRWGAYMGRVEHVMEEGTYGAPGSNFALEASPDDPALAVRLYMMDGDQMVETEFSTGVKASEVEVLEQLEED